MLIERLRGQICLSLASGAIVDVNGVGYRVEMPLSMVCELPPVGSNIELWTYTYVKEDALRLFGFTNYGERIAFELLLGLSGVGPKLALAILSTLDVASVRSAVLQERSDVFEVVPGIGKRLAEKILLDLKPKIDRLAAALDGGGVGTNRVNSHLSGDTPGNDQAHYILHDLRSALENLGFKDKQISPVLRELTKDGLEFTFQDAMRQSLAKLGAMPQKEQDANKSLAATSKLDSVDSSIL